MEAWHATLVTAGRLPLFPTEEERREGVRALARVSRRDLAAFCIAGNHVHLLALGRPRAVGRRTRAVCLALGAVAGVRLVCGDRERMGSLSYLHRTVRYLLRQPVKDRLPGHPALWPGSAFLDLVGARALPGLSLRLEDLLPGCDPQPAVGLAGFAIGPASPAEIRRRGAFVLAAAAGAALAAPPDLEGRSPPVVAARAAVVHLSRASAVSPAEVSAALRVSPRAVRRFASRPPPPVRILDAVRRRLTLESIVASLARPVVPSRDDDRP